MSVMATKIHTSQTFWKVRAKVFLNLTIRIVGYFDGKNSSYAKLPDLPARYHGQPLVNDYTTTIRSKLGTFFRHNSGWKSIDDSEMPIRATVGYGWNGILYMERMVFGNGNPEMFNVTGS
ncbi:MAG: hypothetical protein Q9224_006979 [Gallowayella concinna]